MATSEPIISLSPAAAGLEDVLPYLCEHLLSIVRSDPAAFALPASMLRELSPEGGLSLAECKAQLMDESLFLECEHSVAILGWFSRIATLSKEFRRFAEMTVRSGDSARRISSEHFTSFCRNVFEKRVRESLVRRPCSVSCQTSAFRMIEMLFPFCVLPKAELLESPMYRMTVDGMKDFPDRVPGYPFMLVAEARLLNVIGLSIDSEDLFDGMGDPAEYGFATSSVDLSLATTMDLVRAGINNVCGISKKVHRLRMPYGFDGSDDDFDVGY